MAAGLLNVVNGILQRRPVCRRMGIGGLLIVVAMAGCQESRNRTLAERVGVSGTVKLDGRPLSAGAIVLHAVPDENSPVAPTAFAYIEDGHYRIDAEHGLTAGTVRVEFRPKPLDRIAFEHQLEDAWRQRRPANLDVVTIPERYGRHSELTVELVAGAENRHDFALYSDSRRK